MPVGFSSAPRNLWLLGASGQQVVTNFFKQMDASNASVINNTPSAIKYNESDEKYVTAGYNNVNSGPKVGYLEKVQEDGSKDWNIGISKTAATGSGDGIYLNNLHIDSNDRLLVCGYVNNEGPFLSRYDNNGVLEWQSTTNSGDVEYTSVTSDSSNVYYACGHTTTTPSIAFVERFGSGGVPSWGKSAHMLGRDVKLNNISVNDRGEVVAVGSLEDDTRDKGYIVKIDTTTGQVMWDRTLDYRDPGPGNIITNKERADVTITRCYIDGNDNIYITGQINSLKGRMFVAKYSPEGNLLWQKMTTNSINVSDGFSEYPFGIYADTETEQIAVAYSSGSAENSFIYTAKYSKSGKLLWRRRLDKGTNLFDDKLTHPVGDGLDGSPSFYFLLFQDASDPDDYTFGKVSTAGNGLGNFQYDDGTGLPLINYVYITGDDDVGLLSDGSIRNDTSDFIRYPISPNHIVFDDLATPLSNKKRQMDSADSFEYSGSPAIRPTDFQELNLLGDQIRTEETTGGVGEVDASSESKITPSDGVTGDRFGYRVAVGSNKIVVSSHLHDIAPDSNQGAVYVYDLDGTNEVKIIASDAASSDQFGHSVAIGNDKIVVGAWADDDNGSQSGSAYIYNLDGTGEVKIDASDGLDNDRYGWSIAVGSNKVVVGAPNDDVGGNNDEGSAYIYNLDGTGEVKLTASDGTANDKFGISVAVGSNKVVVGTETKDAVYVYDLDGSNELKITPSGSSGEFGYAVAVGENKIVVGDYGDNSSIGAVYVYDLDGTNEVKITASDGQALDRLGLSVAVGNGKIVAGAQRDDDAGSDAGAAYVFDLDGTNEVKLTANDGTADHYYGSSVAVGSNKVVVGERAITTPGGAYVYPISAGTITSTFWVDQSGKGNEGVVSGATHNAAGYWDFDGTNDRIEIPWNNKFNFGTGEWAIEFWSYNNGGGNGSVISWGDALNDRIDIGPRTGNTAFRFLWDYSGSAQYKIDNISTPNAAWYHCVVTRQSNTVRVYIDSVEEGSVSITGTEDFPTGTTYGIDLGRRRYADVVDAGDYLNGRIGEVRIYPRALTTAQVFQNYNATKTKYINEAPDTAPKIGPGIVTDSNLILNYDFGNKACFELADNRFDNSTNYGSSNWNLQSTNGITLNTTDVLSPVGDYTATKWRPQTLTSQYIYDGVGSLGTDQYTMSVYVRAADGETADFRFNLYSPTQFSSINTATDEWNRFTWTFTAQSQTNAYPVVFEDLDKSLYIWGPQLEPGPTAKRYIPTYGNAISSTVNIRNLSGAEVDKIRTRGDLPSIDIWNEGGWVDFNGSSDFIQVSSNLTSGTTSEFLAAGAIDSEYTLEVWVYVRSSSGTTTSADGIIGHTSTHGVGIQVGVSGGLPRINFGARGTSNFYSSTFQYNTWTHVVLTRDGQEGAKGYRNAVQEGSDSTSSSSLEIESGQTIDNFQLGYCGPRISGYFDGLIGEARVYNRALTAGEVSRNFNATKGKYGL